MTTGKSISRISGRAITRGTRLLLQLLAACLTAEAQTRIPAQVPPRTTTAPPIPRAQTGRREGGTLRVGSRVFATRTARPAQETALLQQLEAQKTAARIDMGHILGGGDGNKPGIAGAKSVINKTAPLVNSAICPINLGPHITSISGVVAHIVFTQDPARNPYTVKGCNFGTQQGQAHLYGPFATPNGQVKLVVDYWSDTLIEFSVDPSLQNELDHDHVTFVLVPATGPQIQIAGNRFFAQRETHLLTHIPVNHVMLGQTYAGFAQIAPELLSPLRPNAGARVYRLFDGHPDITFFPAGVNRDLTNVNGKQGFAKNDSYEISGMKPGYFLESYQPYFLEESSEYKTNGQWSAQMDTPTRIEVSVEMAYVPGHSVLFIGDPDETFSSYGLLVWVTGPKWDLNTFDPWP